MSKGLGQKITVKFTEDLTSVIDTSLQAYKELKTGITVSGSSIGSLANLLDNNTSTVWGHNIASNFIQIDLQATQYRPQTITSPILRLKQAQ